MPLFWRYLIKEYTKVLSLTIFLFISILLILRLEEVAKLASMGGHFQLIVFFILLQIPYILPIALPIAALISSMILFRRLSHSFELTALRSHGFSLYHIMAPVLLMSVFFSIFNFYITSEISTEAHLSSKRMIYKHTSLNPLLLLQNAKIAGLKSAYVEMLPSKHGESAKNVLIALPGKDNHPLNLLIAKKIKVKEKNLIAEKVSLITGIPTHSPEFFNASFDHLVIENQQRSKGEALEFARLLRESKWKISNDHLKFSLLAAKIDHFKKLDSSFFEKNVQKCYSEIMRRFSLALAPFIFTFMGVAFGIEQSREHTKKGVLIVFALSSFSLICFFAGKEFDAYFFIATALFFIPHLLTFFVSKRAVKRIEEGVR